MIMFILFFLVFIGLYYVEKYENNNKHILNRNYNTTCNVSDVPGKSKESDVDEHNEDVDEHNEDVDEHNEDVDEHNEHLDEHIDEHNEDVDEHNEDVNETNNEQISVTDKAIGLQELLLDSNHHHKRIVNNELRNRKVKIEG